MNSKSGLSLITCDRMMAVDRAGQLPGKSPTTIRAMSAVGVSKRDPKSLLGDILPAIGQVGLDDFLGFFMDGAAVRSSGSSKG